MRPYRVRVREKRAVRCCSGWLIFFIVLFLALFLVLIFTVPSDAVYEYRTSVLSEPNTLRSNIAECTAGEEFSQELRMCVPKISTPDPVSPEMMDNSIGACDSFYHHTCGAWIHNHTNEDRSFTYVYRKNWKRIQRIVTSPASGTPYMFYRSCLDTLVYGKHMDKTKSEIEHLYHHILLRLESHQDLPMILGRLAKYGLTAPFSLSIENNPIEPSMIPMIQKTNLHRVGPELLEDMTIQEFASLEQLLFQLEMFADDSEQESDYTTYEEYVADHFAFDVYNFSSFNNDLFWKQYFLELGGANLEHDLLFNERVWIPDGNHHFISQLLQRLDTIPLVQWKAYVKYSILYNSHNFMPVLPSDSYFRHHDLMIHKDRIFDHHLYGRRVQDSVSEQHCVSLTNVMLPGIVAEKYLQIYMPNAERTRQKVTLMAESIRDAYSELIGETEWLHKETRAAAQEKLSNIVIRAIHPNTWEIEPFHTRIQKTEYVKNLFMIRKYRVDRNLQLWSLYKESTIQNGRDSVQRFGAPLTTVNAYYSPVTNTITVFAGIVTAPFYSENYSPAALYATLGMIIGHELSHFGDNSGRLFDLNGSLVPWWPEEDVQQFIERSKCIVKEYGPPQGCENVDYGTQTLGEDIADITGITIALKAYEKQYGTSLKNRRKFFTIFAQMWAESYDQRHLCNRVDNDVHAVAWFRVDKTLRQLDAFQKAFKCGEDSAMVNENKCKIYG